MTGSDATARQDAIDWAIRTQDEAFNDWEAFETWLAADPVNAVLYDRATRSVDEAATTIRIGGADRGAKVRAFPRVARRGAPWVPSAVAASLIAAIGGGGVLFHAARQPMLYAVETPAGEHRSVVIDGATTVELGGDTRLTLDHHDPRYARLDRGEALFAVRHDPQRPFRLQVGGISVTDVGTLFDVAQDLNATRVAVAEGAVRVTTSAGSAELPAGHAVSIGRPGGTVVQRDQDPATIGAWRTGRIDFADMSLIDLAERLRRATGVRLEVTADVATRRVSGSVALGSDPDGALRGLALLLGTSVTRRGDVWIWSGGAGPS
jgi:transmembrane sensor